MYNQLSFVRHIEIDLNIIRLSNSLKLDYSEEKKSLTVRYN